MLHEPFTLFTFRWNGRFLHLHQNICNNHCNTATKAYHTRNQRAMVADHLQRAMAICHTTVTDVADGFQRIRHRNELIFKCMDFRCRCVCDSIWQDKDTVFTCLDEHPNASREILQRAKAHSRIRQGEFFKTPRTFSKSSWSLKNKQLFLDYIINLIIFANKKARRNASKPSFSLFKAIDGL